MFVLLYLFFFFFFNDTATTEIYTFPTRRSSDLASPVFPSPMAWPTSAVSGSVNVDRKSTRLNSSHSQISYAVFCLKKKKKKHYVYTYSWTHSSPAPFYMPLSTRRPLSPDITLCF